MKKLLYFTADWCGPCRQMSPNVSMAMDKFGEIYTLEKIDVDTQPVLCSRMNVRGVPTMIILDEQGQEVARKTGAMNYSKFVEWLADYRVLAATVTMPVTDDYCVLKKPRKGNTMLTTLRNWFYKDTRVVVQAGPHMMAGHDVTMSTVATGHELEKWHITRNTSPWPVKIGTYAVIDITNFWDPLDIAYWATFHSVMGSVDVTGQIECSGVKPMIYFGADNPMIGQPSFTIWSADGSMTYKRRFGEGDEYVFSDKSGHNVKIRRNGDSSYKEWTVTIDP